MELLLLLTRSALKERWRDRIRGLAGQPILGTDSRREWAWLRERADPATMLALADELLGGAAAERLGALLEGTWRDRGFRAFAVAARRSLACCRTYGPVGAPWLAWMRKMAWLADGLNRRFLHRPVPMRRVSPRGGLVVALLGSDGSGKSTLTAALRGWLGAKLDVVPIYFGSGDGPSSLYRLPMRVLARRLRSRAPGNGSGSPPMASPSLLRRLGRVPWAIALAAEKRSKLRTMIRARNRGMIVICDRFPQNQRLGFNDGPLLGDWIAAPGRLRRFLADWETAIYDSAASTGSPDLVLKLIATPTVAVARKPEMSLEENERRVASIRALVFSPSTLTIEMDADRSLDLIISEAKAIIWRFL
jgi:thymidylate kinase